MGWGNKKVSTFLFELRFPRWFVLMSSLLIRRVIACRGVTVFNSSVNKFPHKVKLFHQQRATFLLPQLKNVKEEAPVSPETGNHILYRGRHERSLLTMLGVTFFNFMYWSYQLTISYAYKGVVMNGIEMGGDIKWPIIGMCGTAIMVVSTRLYSRNCVRQAYLTPDGRRLGFQVHTIFAVAGPKFEALLSNTSLVEKEQQKMLMRSIIPVKLGRSHSLCRSTIRIFSSM
jgi:hypothetical protein